MAKNTVTPRAALIAEQIKAGQSRKEAAAHADKILGERDRVEVTKDGTEVAVTPGPML